MTTQQKFDLVGAFTKVRPSDDIEGVMTLFASDCKWVIVATGETFREQGQVRELATRSVEARMLPGDMGLKPFTIFTNSEGTKLIWEYVHTGVVTDRWPASTHKVAPGTKFELPIILICELRDDKIVEIREYFDLLTLIEPDTQHRLYS